MSVYYYINKEGDRKIGRPDKADLYAKIGYTPENKDTDNDGLQDGNKELEDLRDQCTESGIKFDGRCGVKALKKLLSEDK